MTARRWLFVFAALVVLPADLAACSCTPKPRLRQDVAAIFKGRVVSIEESDVSAVKVTFEVSEAWGGVDSRTVSVHTGRGWGDCGYAFFRIGDEYIVPAHSGVDGVLLTGDCMGIASLPDRGSVPRPVARPVVEPVRMEEAEPRESGVPLGVVYGLIAGVVLAFLGGRLSAGWRGG